MSNWSPLNSNFQWSGCFILSLNCFSRRWHSSTISLKLKWDVVLPLLISGEGWRGYCWRYIFVMYALCIYTPFICVFLYLFNLQESNLQVRPPALGSCAFPQHCSHQWTCEGTKSGLRVDCRCLVFWQLIWAVSLVSALSILKST